MPVNDSQRRRTSFFLISYFVQGAIGIVYEPLNYLLKDHLKLTPGQASGFIAWMTLPLLFKPLFGLASDFIPFGRGRRKPPLRFASLIAALAFLFLAAQIQYRFFSLLLPMTLSIVALAFADAACDGWLVEEGKARHETGRYQALHIGALYLSAIVVGAGGGWLTAHVPYRWIFAIAGALPVATVLASLFVHEDAPAEKRTRSPGHLWAFIQTKRFRALGLTIVLWNFYPFLGTVQFYYQSSVLRLTPQWIGSLMTVGSVMGLLGSAVFWKLCRGKDVNSWLSKGPIVMALVSLSYVFYRGPVSVTVIESVFGFGTVFFRLALLDLIARSCPVDAEATVYSLFLTFFEIAMYGSNALGGKLYDLLQHLPASTARHDHASAMGLIVIGSLCTLACHWTLPAREDETLKA